MQIPKPRRLDKWTLAHRATALAFLALLILGRFDAFPWFKGSAAATRAFDVIHFADPLGALEAIVASRQFTLTLLLSAGLLIVVYAIVGRAFCGWICPLGLVLELNDDLRTRVNRFLRRRKKALPDFQFPRNTKYAILFTFLILSFVIQLPVFQIVSPINLLARSFIFGPEAGLILVGAIVAFEYVSRRAWCIALCPLGAFYSVVGKFAPLRIKIDQEKEKAGKMCGLCAYHCPMQIEVLDDHITRGKSAVDDADCTRCGSCMDGCPRDSLRMGMTNPKGS
jgi:ferredoxin-type protein NapH